MYNNNMLLSIIMLIYFRDTGQPSLLFQDNHVDWAPSLHLGHEAVPKTSVEKYDRALRRDNTKRQSQSCHTEIEAAKRRKGVETTGKTTETTTRDSFSETTGKDTTETTTDSFPDTTGKDTNETTETTTTDSFPETVINSTVDEMDSLAKLKVEMKELKQNYTRLNEENAALRVEKKEL